MGPGDEELFGRPRRVKRLWRALRVAATRPSSIAASEVLKFQFDGDEEKSRQILLVCLELHQGWQARVKYSNCLLYVANMFSSIGRWEYLWCDRDLPKRAAKGRRAVSVFTHKLTPRDPPHPALLGYPSPDHSRGPRCDIFIQLPTLTDSLELLTSGFVVHWDLEPMTLGVALTEPRHFWFAYALGPLTPFAFFHTFHEW